MEALIIQNNSEQITKSQITSEISDNNEEDKSHIDNSSTKQSNNRIKRRRPKRLDAGSLDNLSSTTAGNQETNYKENIDNSLYYSVSIKENFEVDNHTVSTESAENEINRLEQLTDKQAEQENNVTLGDNEKYISKQTRIQLFPLDDTIDFSDTPIEAFSTLPNKSDQICFSCGNAPNQKCIECKKVFCFNCCAIKHSIEDLKHHTTILIGAILCDICLSSSATQTCIDCVRSRMCDKCSSFIHRKLPNCLHKRYPLITTIEFSHNSTSQQHEISNQLHKNKIDSISLAELNKTKNYTNTYNIKTLQGIDWDSDSDTE